MIKKKVSKYWDGMTWGFEVEGVFNRKFLGELGEFEHKRDGSVSNRLVEDLEDACDDTREVTSPVYESLDVMINKLDSIISSDDYAFDTSCGVHIHLKPKEILSAQSRFWRGGDYLQKQKEMQQIAIDVFGSTMRSRLLGRTNTYASGVGSATEACQIYFTNAKYTSMRNHPQGTIEMRMFHPCANIGAKLREFFNRVYVECVLPSGKARKRFAVSEQVQFLTSSNKQKKVCVI